MSNEDKQHEEGISDGYEKNESLQTKENGDETLEERIQILVAENARERALLAEQITELQLENERLKENQSVNQQDNENVVDTLVNSLPHRTNKWLHLRIFPNKNEN